MVCCSHLKITENCDKRNMKLPFMSFDKHGEGWKGLQKQAYIVFCLCTQSPSVFYIRKSPLKKYFYLTLFMYTVGDIACELSRHAKQVYVSTRRGSYVVQRMAAHGVPSDLKFLNRVVQCLPKPLLMWLIKRRVSSLFNLSDLGLEPIGDESLSVILINDELPHRIVTGTLIMKDEIIGFKDKKVFFKDHTELDNIDDVIFATGFNVCASFLHKSVMNPDTAMSGHQSYKAVFPLGLSHPTLALIGFCRVAGSVIPVIEMQARFAMEVFKGDFILPSQDLMKKEVVERRAPFLKNDKKSASAGSYFVSLYSDFEGCIFLSTVYIFILT